MENAKTTFKQIGSTDKALEIVKNTGMVAFGFVSKRGKIMIGIGYPLASNDGTVRTYKSVLSADGYKSIKKNGIGKTKPKKDKAEADENAFADI